MKFGIFIFATDKSMDFVDLARAAEERDGPELEVLRHVVHGWEAVEPWLQYEELFASDLHAATFRVLMAHPTVQEAIEAADPGVADLIGRLATEELQAEHPRLVTATMTKARRRDKVFLDWSQNAGSKTTIAPYSLRGRERPYVAAPVSWDEVAEGAEDPLGLEQITFGEVLDRVERLGDLFSWPRAPVRAPSSTGRRPLLPNGGDVV